MTRVIAKIVIQDNRYVALYCNTLDKIISPTFDNENDFETWLEEKWLEEDNHALWVNESKVWLDHGV